MNRYVAKMVVLAQIASDAGKGIREMNIRDLKAERAAKKRAYEFKDVAIKYAILAILRDKSSGFVFHVSRGGITPHLVYFNFKLNGERKQISFHSYDPWLDKFHKNHNRNLASEYCITRWDEGYSRGTAIELANALDI